MIKSFNLNKLLIFGLPLSLLLSLIFIMNYSPLVDNEYLNIGITLDLLISVPLLYFLLIRKTNIPNTTIVPVIVLGLLIGTLFLPKGNQYYLELFKVWVMPFIEIAALTYIVVKIRLVRKRYQALKEVHPDFYSSLKEVCREFLPAKVVPVFATEIAVIYYGFINWKKRALKAHEFSYHRHSGTATLMGVFIFLIAVETYFLHIYLLKWSEIAAWILTGLSCYTAIQLLGFLKSLSKRPIVIERKQLVLRYGILSEVTIPFADIEQIELTKKSIEKDVNVVTLSPFSELESHNVVIHLKKTGTLSGFYGIKKSFSTLLLHLDDASGFKTEIDKSLSAIWITYEQFSRSIFILLVSFSIINAQLQVL